MSDTGTISKKELCLRSKGILCAYVQIPFCKSVCPFCCWSKNYDPSEILAIQKFRKPYLEALKREIRAKGMSHHQKERVNLQVIHFGGGTPSLLRPDELQEILFSILEDYDQQIESIMSVGIEARPDDLSRRMLEDLKSIGFNRISVGAQSFDQGILDRLNRRSHVENFYRSYDLLRSAGFEDVNIDLLYGFPFQNLEQIRNDVKTVIRLEPEHIDFHPWKPVSGPLYEPSETCYQKEKEKKIKAALYIRDQLLKAGYNNYNHRCFCKPGKENLMHLIEATYGLPFLAFGAGSEQYRAPKTTTSIQEYIHDPFTSDIYKKMPGESINFNLIRFVDSMIKQLLLPEGIYIPFFNKRHHCDMEGILSIYGNPKNITKEIQKYRNTNLYLFQASRVQIFKKMLKWIEKGIITKHGDYLRLEEEHRISPETWVLYMQAC